MEVDRRIRGVAYIGRIKGVNSHQGVDEVYGIVYQGRCEMDYTLFSSMCSTHNDKFFYARKINKKSMFTMRECMEAVQNFPMIGTGGVSLVDHPMTFPEFGHMAYDHGVLTSNSGFALISGEAAVEDAGTDGFGMAGDDGDVDAVQKKLSETAPPQKTSALCNRIIKKQNLSKMVKDAGNQAKDYRVYSEDMAAFTQSEQQLMGMGSVDMNSALNDDIPVGREEVIGDPQPGYENLSLDAVRDRCLVSETKTASLQVLLKERDEEIVALKAELSAVKESSVGFMKSADLEAARVRAQRKESASEVVEGIKPELALVKGISVKMNSLSSDNEEQNQLLAEVLGSLEDLPNRLTGAFSSFESSVNENSKALETAVNSNTKTMAENVMKIWKVLEEFGISPRNDPVDIPKTVSDLARVHCVEKVDAGAQTFSLPEKETTGDLLAPNGLSRWIGGPGGVGGREPGNVDAVARPVNRFVASKAFDDYIPSDEEDVEVVDDVEEVKMVSCSRSTPASFSGKGGKRFLLEPQGVQRGNSGLGLMGSKPPAVGSQPQSLFNNNRGFSSGSVWSHPPPGLKRDSSHLQGRRKNKERRE